MRTIDDLRGALELRARLADPQPAETDAPASVSPLTLASRRAPRHRLATSLSAAAVVLVLVALAVRVLTASDGSAPAGSGESLGRLPAGEWAFSLADLPDLTFRSYSWFDGELQQLDLRDRHRVLDLTVYATQVAYGERGFPQLHAAADGSGLPGAERVRVGDDVAYYGAFGDTSHVTPGTVEAAAANMLIWQYAPDAWALLHQQGSIDEDELLRVARAIDFSKTTPVRTPVTFDAPAGTHLLDWEITGDHGLDVKPRSPWTVRAAYATAPGDSDVVIDAYSYPMEFAGSGSPVPTTIGGRPAQFYPTDPRLDFAALDFAIGAYGAAEIRWPSQGGVDPTEEQLVALAETMHAVDDPAEYDSWFDGRTVLP